MAKIEIVKIGHIEFLKDCAKGRTITQFKNDHKHPNFSGIDLDKAYITLGGKKKKSEID